MWSHSLETVNIVLRAWSYMLYSLWLDASPLFGMFSDGLQQVQQTSVEGILQGFRETQNRNEAWLGKVTAKMHWIKDRSENKWRWSSVKNICFELLSCSHVGEPEQSRLHLPRTGFRCGIWDADISQTQLNQPTRWVYYNYYIEYIFMRIFVEYASYSDTEM